MAVKDKTDGIVTTDLPEHGPVIPVITIDDAAHAVPLASALVAGGVRVLEVTLRTDAALQAIEAIAKNVPDAIVGAGTVMTASDVTDCAQAGARFAVSPGFTTSLARQCSDQKLPLLPGVSTASEIMQASEAGFSFLKLFPAVAVGGLSLLKALHGPFGQTRFCPTGGVNVDNAPAFLSLPNVLCVGGSWLTPKSLIDAGDWTGIEKLARDASQMGHQQSA